MPVQIWRSQLRSKPDKHEPCNLGVARGSHEPGFAIWIWPTPRKALRTPAKMRIPTFTRRRPHFLRLDPGKMLVRRANAPGAPESAEGIRGIRDETFPMDIGTTWAETQIC